VKLEISAAPDKHSDQFELVSRSAWDELPDHLDRLADYRLS
jgi:hypothetical protein